MEGTEYLCGVPEHQLNEAAARMARWTKRRVSWTVTGLIPPFTREALLPIYAAACRQWSEVCGLELVYTDGASGADIVMGSGFIDGPGKVLAWSELPDGSDRPLQQRYDTHESWDETMALGVACHELGHAIGLSHGPTGALMAPYFTRSVLRPQDWDRRQVVDRYGPPAGTPSPTPPTPPGASKVRIEIAFVGAAAVTQEIVNASKITIPGYKVIPL